MKFEYNFLNTNIVATLTLDNLMTEK